MSIVLTYYFKIKNAYNYHKYLKVPIGCVITYIFCEYLNYRRYKQHYNAVSIPIHGDKVGTLENIEWFYASLTSPDKPTNLEISEMQRHSAKKITWEDVYSTLREYLSVHDSSYNKQKHLLLVKCTDVICQKYNISMPPQNLTPHVPHDYLPPSVHGTCKFKSIYKPLFLMILIKIFKHVTDFYCKFLGYKCHTLFTSNGKINLLVKDIGAKETIVFVHGLLLYGGAGYMRFLSHFSEEYNIIIVQLPNISLSHHQSKFMSFGELGLVLSNFLKKHHYNDYYLMGHSLGTDICTGLLNDERKIFYPKKLVLIDPICFSQNMVSTHRIVFWEWEEICAKLPKMITLLKFLVLYFFIYDINSQHVTKRLTGDSISIIYRPDTYDGDTFVYLAEKDYIIQTGELRDYLQVHFPAMKIDFVTKASHGSFLLNSYFTSKLVKNVKQFLQS
jgi:pimeloyl-ACP methyl ester carboxylesterase